MTEEMISQFQLRHLRGQNFLLQKSDEEIMQMAKRIVKFERSQRNWQTDSSVYDVFLDWRTILFYYLRVLSAKVQADLNLSMIE